MTIKQLDDLILAQHPMMFRNAVGYGIAAAPKHIHKLKGGGYLVDKGAPIRFGLLPGSSDWVGWEPVVITADMVGKTLAVFCSIEEKLERDRLSADQRTWNRSVQRDGGIVEVWHVKGDAVEILKGEDII